MSSSLVELQSLIAQSLDGTPRSRRDHQGFQVALISPHRSLVPSSCLVVEFCHNNIKYHILFSNGTTALVQVSSPKTAAADLPQENHQLLSISHSQDAVEIYSDLSSQLEIIQSVEQVHDLRKFLYFIFIVYFQKNRLPCSRPELENQAELQVVPMRPYQGRPKALSVEKRLCLPYEVRRKLTFENTLALTDKPAWENKPIVGVELGRRLVIPMFDPLDKKEILITRKNIARDFLQNLILQKLQKRIPSLSRTKNEVLASSAQGPIPLPCQESFEAPKPVLKMNSTLKEKIVSIPPQNLLSFQKFKNHIEIFGSTRKALVTPLKQTMKRSKKSQSKKLFFNNYCLVPSLPGLSFERNFNRIISERVAKINSSMCEKSLNLLQIWAKSNNNIQAARVSIPLPSQPILSSPLRNSFFLTQNHSLNIQSQALVVSRKLKLSSGLSNSSLNSILKAHYNSIQHFIQRETLELLPLNISKPRQPLALTYKPTLALPYMKTLALTYNVEKVYALPYVQRLAITYSKPEAIPLHGTGPVIALPNKPVLALTYKPTLALPYQRVFALECEKKLAITYENRGEQICDIYRFLEPKWLDFLGAHSLPKGTLKLFSEPNCLEQTASVEISFSSSQSEDEFDYDLDEEVSLQESLIEESRGENLPLLQAQSTSELSEIDLDLQVSTQIENENIIHLEEEDYGFEVIADDDVVIIEAPEDTIVSIDEI